MTEAERPAVYFFLSHHELRKRVLTMDPPDVLAALIEVHGSLPDELDSEELIQVFALGGNIPLADLDIDPDLIHPHRLYASRAWLKTEYKVFLDWCLENGWLDEPVERRIRPVTWPTKAEEVKADPAPVAQEGISKFMIESGMAELTALNGPTVPEDDDEVPVAKPKAKKARS